MIWIVVGHEFRMDKGAVFIITWALYGLKSAGAAWRTSFTQALAQLEFWPTCGDPDVYIKPQTKPDGTRYYEMLLVYVDDILVLSHDTKPINDGIVGQLRLKEDSLRPPNQYLGATIKIFMDDDGYESWAMSSDDYVKAAVAEVIKDLDKWGLKLKGKAYHPYESGYRPEMDVWRNWMRLVWQSSKASLGRSAGWLNLGKWTSILRSPSSQVSRPCQEQAI